MAYVLNRDVYNLFWLRCARQVSCVFQYQRSDTVLDHHKYFVHLVMGWRYCLICLAGSVENLEFSVVGCSQYSMMVHDAVPKNP